jgi:hypothetical protein
VTIRFCAAVGYVVGVVLDELLDVFKDYWEDDIFPPITVGFTVPWGYTFGERTDSPNNKVWWKAHGGHYRLYFDWQLLGPPLVAGVFREGSDNFTLWTQNRPGFEAKYGEFTAGGLRLVGLSTYVDGSTPRITGAFRAGSDKHALAIGDWQAFAAKWQQLS